MKYTIVGLTLFLFVISAWAGTLKDNFNGGNMDEWIKVGNGDWKIENGELILKSNNIPFGLTIGETSWTDYSVSARTKIIEYQNDGWIDAAALMLRWSSMWNGYDFCLGDWFATGKSVFALYLQGDNFEGHNIVSLPFQWKLNTWYHLKVTAKGNTFKFYVDDELVLNYVDNVHSTGRPGIGVGVTATIAHFEDFVLTGDEVPDLDLTFPVSPSGKITTLWGRIKTLKH